MSLTPAEDRRLNKIEAEILTLTRLIKGAGSKNQLNRLLVLQQKTNEELEEKVEGLESEMSDLLALARKLQ